MWEAIPEIIRAFSDAGVSGYWFGIWICLFIVGVFWGGKNMVGLRRNVAEHFKSKTAES